MKIKNLMILTLSGMLLTSIAISQTNPSGQDPQTGQNIEEDNAVKEMSEADMMKMWQESITPGEEHAAMAEHVGTYNYVSKFWMTPDAEPQISKGKTVVEPIMEGRYFKETHTGTAMGMPFEGVSIYGYNKATKKYESIWYDNLGTGIMNFVGKMNDEGQMVSKAETVNPMTQQQERHKVVQNFGDNGWTMDYYIKALSADGSGEWVHSMQIEYKKVK